MNVGDLVPVLLEASEDFYFLSIFLKDPKGMINECWAGWMHQDRLGYVGEVQRQVL